MKIFNCYHNFMNFHQSLKSEKSDQTQKPNNEASINLTNFVNPLYNSLGRNATAIAT